MKFVYTYAVYCVCALLAFAYAEKKQIDFNRVTNLAVQPMAEDFIDLENIKVQSVEPVKSMCILTNKKRHTYGF